MPKYGEMNSEEKKTMINSCTELIKAAGFAEKVKIQENGELVCNITEGHKEYKTVVEVSGTLKKSQEEESKKLIE